MPVDMTLSRDKASAIIPQDVSKSQEIDNELSVHIPECDVDIEKGQKEHADSVMCKVICVEYTYNHIQVRAIYDKQR